MISSKSNFSRSSFGFSLPEMLLVIAIIGIIAAIAIPYIANINEKSRIAAAQGNAQNIATISASANAAGAFHVVPESLGGGVAMSIDILTVGVNAEDFDLNFSIKLNEDQINAAAEHLSIANMGGEYVLVYNAK